MHTTDTVEEGAGTKVAWGEDKGCFAFVQPLPQGRTSLLPNATLCIFQGKERRFLMNASKLLILDIPEIKSFELISVLIPG